MMKKISGYLLAIVTLVVFSIAHAGQLQIENVWVDHQGQTFTTDCINTRGFYFEIGASHIAQHFMVYGDGGKMPLKIIVEGLLIKGWQAKFGNRVDTQKLVSWRGHMTWQAWLKKLAFRNNLAIIVDVENKTVYIEKI